LRICFSTNHSPPTCSVARARNLEFLCQLEHNICRCNFILHNRAKIDPSSILQSWYNRTFPSLFKFNFKMCNRIEGALYRTRQFDRISVFSVQLTRRLLHKYVNFNSLHATKHVLDNSYFFQFKISRIFSKRLQIHRLSGVGTK